MHKYLLRLPLPLWDQIRECATQNGRSVNAEIIWRLRKSIEGYTR